MAIGLNRDVIPQNHLLEYFSCRRGIAIAFFAQFNLRKNQWKNLSPS